MKYIKIIFINFFILIILSACQGIRENLSLKKKQGVDEFLIEKKNPLVVPPEISKLPETRDEEKKNDENEQNVDLTKILGDSKKVENSNSSKELEKSISNILKKK